MIDRTIKFTYAPDGKLDLNSGKGGLNDVFEIGAIASTFTQSFSGDGATINEFATDRQGLETILQKNQGLLDHINYSLSSLGVLMAYVDVREVEGELVQLGWLINSLSELSARVSSLNFEINVTLRTKKPD